MIVYALVSVEQNYEDPDEISVLGVFTSLERAKAEIDSKGWEDNKNGTWSSQSGYMKWTITATELIDDAINRN